MHQSMHLQPTHTKVIVIKFPVAIYLILQKSINTLRSHTFFVSNTSLSIAARLNALRTH